jgi:small subunit ribosomal protein S15
MFCRKFFRQNIIERKILCIVIDLVNIKGSPVMVLDEKRSKALEQFRHGANDTGSVEVQIIVMSQEIERLTKHFAVHAKDHSSKRGLFRMLNSRRSFLNYLKKNNKSVYERLIDALGLKAS